MSHCGVRIRPKLKQVRTCSRIRSQSARARRGSSRTARRMGDRDGGRDSEAKAMPHVEMAEDAVLIGPPGQQDERYLLIRQDRRGRRKTGAEAVATAMLFVERRGVSARALPGGHSFIGPPILGAPSRDGRQDRIQEGAAKPRVSDRAGNLRSHRRRKRTR